MLLPAASGGAASHLGTELLQLTAGISMVHVPYKGTGPGMAALLAGAGLEPQASTPGEFAELIKREIPKWEKVVRTAGLKADCAVGFTRPAYERGALPLS